MSLENLCLQKKKKRKRNAYVSLTTATLSRRLTMLLPDSNSVTLHLKTRSIPKFNFSENSS